MGTSGVAQAAADLDAGTGVLTFAQEASVPTDLDVTVAGGGVAAQANFGFTIGDGTSKYVRLTFDQAIAADLAVADFGSTNGNATFSISQGGLAGDTFVTVEVSANGGDVLATDDFQFLPQDGDEIEATDKSTRSLSFVLYETAVDAVNETNALVSKSGNWITWDVGYAVSCGTTNTARIDVVTPTQFIGAVTANDVATVTVDDVASVFTPAGVEVAIATDYFTVGAPIVIAGDINAFDTAADDVTLAGQDAEAIPADGEALFAVAAAAAAGDVTLPLSGALFSVDADGDEINPSSYTFSITDDGDATFDVGTVTVDCGSLLYSGSTDRLDFALTPNGAFTQFARITNPSSTAGDVTVTVYNDDGESVSFDLGDVTGVDSNNLAAEASTKLININDIYAAAQAADPAFALAATGPDSKNKLRVEVRGEFGDDAQESDGAGETLTGRTSDGIYIQGLTVARDNNAFFQTK